MGVTSLLEGQSSYTVGMLFDTHCHFDSLDDAHNQLPIAYEAGLRAINIVGCDLETSQRSIDVARLIEKQRFDLGFSALDGKATVGLHPHEAQHLDSQREELEKLIDQNIDVICGIGETGYDFYYNYSTKQDQTKSFIWQIELAKKHNKCLVIHTRDAWTETFSLLDEQGWPQKCVFHCFTGGPAEALRAVENGAYVSISGIATFKNAQDIRDAIEVVPLQNLLVETDSPYLAPVPHRGKTNQPSFVHFVAEQVADIRESKCSEDREQVFQSLFDNSVSAFR